MGDFIGDYIERKIKIKGKEVTAKYSPKTGKFAFGKSNKLGYSNTELTGLGAFSTMKALIDSFRDVNPQKICYSSQGMSEKEVRTKDKLYARELKRLGYREKTSSDEFFRDWLTTEWNGPDRIWVREKKE